MVCEDALEELIHGSRTQLSDRSRASQIVSWFVSKPHPQQSWGLAEISRSCHWEAGTCWVCTAVHCNPNAQQDTGGPQLQAQLHSMILSLKKKVRAQCPFCGHSSFSGCLFSHLLSVLCQDILFPLGSLCGMPHICALRQQEEKEHVLL